MAFRCLHLADLHLETRYGGRPETRAELGRAAHEAFRRAVNFAIDRELHAVLVAGDLFDEPVLSLASASRIAREVRRLAEAGVSFLWVAGNHDPGGADARIDLLGLSSPASAGVTSSDERWRERVHLFRAPEPLAVVVRDRAGRPVGRVVGAGHPDSACAENLAARFPRAAELARDLPLVGLLHTQVLTARNAERHKRYAPSSREDFERAGYDYWALGHVHLQQQAVPGLPVWYSGNLQGRDPRESGAKGGLLVEVEAGVPATPEPVALAPIRWERARIEDLRDAATVDVLFGRMRAEVERACAGEGRAIVVVELAGVCPVAGELRRDVELLEFAWELERETGALEVQLRADELRLAVDRDALKRSPTVLARALDLLERAENDGELLAALAPTELARGLDVADPALRLDYLRELARGLDEELLLRLEAETP